MSGIVAIIVAAAIGAISGVLTTSWKTRKDLESQYDIDLRKQRIDAYRVLWKDLEPLAYYSPPGKLTYGLLEDLAVTLRRWYFEVGGLVISERTRPPYFHLQQALTRLPGAPERERHVELDGDTAEIVKALASRLRTSTTEDVATRVRSRLGPSRFVRRWRAARRPVRVSVDRRWDWRNDGIVPCYFALIENRSFQAVVVNELLLNGGTAKSTEPPLPVTVQAQEAREVTVEAADGMAPGHVPRIEIVLSSGKRVAAQTPPEIPITTPALALPNGGTPAARRGV